tara:strand:- start:8110 stop:9882 length:1773 start_codon:yes stop_codon:yes gene_type:complete
MSYNLSGNPFGLNNLEKDSTYITIGSLRTSKMITFKPFVESFSFSLEKEKEEFTTNEYSPYKDVITKATQINVAIELNIVASNLKEASTNVAKIVELQRMINGNYSEPTVLIVHFSNLINSGLPQGDKVMTTPPGDFNSLKKIGVACVCNEVSYDPDLEKGMLKSSGGKLVPKFIKLSLDLKYVIQKITNRDRKELGNFFLINSFTQNGLFALNDNPLFPFGVLYSNPADGSNYNLENLGGIMQGHQSSFIDSTYRNTKSWIFIGNNIQPSEQNWRDEEFDNILNPTTQENDPEIARANEIKNLNTIYNNDNGIKLMRYVFFDPYIKTFKRVIKVDNKSAQSGNPEPFKTNYNATKFQDIIFNLEFDCPSESLGMGLVNLAKLQTLVRLFSTRGKLSNSGITKNGDEISFQFLQSSNDSFCRVCIPSFLQSAASGPLSWSRTAEPTQSYGASMEVVILDMKITIDASNGFFRDEGGYLVPKNFSISLDMIPFKDSILKDYIITEKDGESTYRVQDPGFGINDTEQSNIQTDPESNTTTKDFSEDDIVFQPSEVRVEESVTIGTEEYAESDDVEPEGGSFEIFNDDPDADY